MKKWSYKPIICIVFLLGLSLFCYPFISDIIESKEQEEEIDSYTEIVNNLSQDKQSELLEEAKIYNNNLRTAKNYSKIKVNGKHYKDILNMDETSVIGYIEINKIGVHLPIYHGVSKYSLLHCFLLRYSNLLRSFTFVPILIINRH